MSQLRWKILRFRRKSGQLKWKFRTDGERRFEAKGLNGFLPKTQTIADPFDIFLSSPVVAQGAVYFGSGDGNVYAVDIITGENAGNSRPAMSFTLHQHSPMALCFLVAGTAIFTQSMPRPAKKSGAFTVAKTRSYITRSVFNLRPRSQTALSTPVVATRIFTHLMPRPEKKNGVSTTN